MLKSPPTAQIDKRRGLTQQWRRLTNFNGAVPQWNRMAATLYSTNGHRLLRTPSNHFLSETLILVYADAILTHVTWPALGIEPSAVHKQPLKPASYNKDRAYMRCCMSCACAIRLAVLARSG